jgi:lipocalin-like protein
MKPFLLLLVLLLLVPAIGQENGLAQSKADLVGTWKLISVTDTTDKGQVIEDASGLNPTGLLTYTADGRMMAIITNGGRKPLSVNDRVAAPAEERAEAFATMMAYAGRYTATGDKVIHHLEVASLQNIVNTDQVRYIVKLEGNRVTLRTPPFLRGGAQITSALVWERIN